MTPDSTGSDRRFTIEHIRPTPEKSSAEEREAAEEALYDVFSKYEAPAVENR